MTGRKDADRRDQRKTVVWAALWLGLTAVCLFSRPLMPLDETRYLGVAWEMWESGDWLIPHLNGEPYSHKPPLLFWLINLVWFITGVDEQAARLVVPLLGLVSLGLTAALARRLWPDRREIGVIVPLVLIGMPFWGGFMTLTFLEVLLAVFVLLALIGLYDSAHGRPVQGWSLTGMAIAFGLLSKGPVALAFILPPAILAPWWFSDTQLSRPSWYGGLLAAVVLGVVIPLAWALLAATGGGEVYGDALIWGQTAGQLVESFPHASPWWHYGAFLPIILFPWCLWPPFWRGVASLGAPLDDPGTRFCISVLAPALVILSTISHKQPYYLIPILPIAALLIARAVNRGGRHRHRLDLVLPAAAIALVILALLALQGTRLIGDVDPLPEWMLGGFSLIGLPVALAALAAAQAPLPAAYDRVALMALSGVMVVSSVHLTAAPILKEGFDLTPIAQHIGRLQERAVPIAHVSNYHNQYHFLGRLRYPIDVIDIHAARTWTETHPDGRLIVSHRVLPTEIDPEFVQRFRGRLVAVWPAKDFADGHSIVLDGSTKSVPRQP